MPERRRWAAILFLMRPSNALAYEETSETRWPHPWFQHPQCRLSCISRPLVSPNQALPILKEIPNCIHLTKPHLTKPNLTELNFIHIVMGFFSGGVFIVIFVGIGLACITLAFEYYWYKYKRNPKVTDLRSNPPPGNGGNLIRNRQGLPAAEAVKLDAGSLVHDMANPQRDLGYVPYNTR